MELESRLVFTVEQRDALREYLLRLAEEDVRVVAGAAVGSLAVDAGDRFSDLDLTFGIADDVPVARVLDDWTRTLVDELDAVHVADLERGPTTYRVFLLPDALQFDISMTPAGRFRPAGPRFRLLFGDTAGEMEQPDPPVAGDIFGWGVIYALHARACIERGRVWQAEHYVGAPCATTRSRLPASDRGYRRCKRAATTPFRQKRWLDSRLLTSPRSNLGLSGQLSPRRFSRSCARAPRRVYRTQMPSPSASPSFADEPPCNQAGGPPLRAARDWQARSARQNSQFPGSGSSMRGAAPAGVNLVTSRTSSWGPSFRAM